MNKEDVFVKPDEQNKACSGSAMVGKDLHKKEHFFLHSNEVNHINRENYDKIELLVNAAKAFARSTYQCVYIIDYFPVFVIGTPKFQDWVAISIKS